MDTYGMADRRDGVIEASGEVVVLASAREGGGETYRHRRRRSWTVEEKIAIVREAESSGDPAAEVARRHGMNANHLFNWIQSHRDGTLDRRARPSSADPVAFLDLGVVGEPRAAAGVIEIELPNRARIRFGSNIETDAI